MNKKNLYNMILFLSTFVVLSQESYSQETQRYCIYMRDYNQWLCNNIRGAERACSAPDYSDSFPDFHACENTRKEALPNDIYWQRMTRCVPCGPSSQSTYQTSPQSGITITIPPSGRGGGRVIKRMQAMAENYREQLKVRYGEEAMKKFDELFSTYLKTGGDDPDIITVYYESIAREYEMKKHLESKPPISDSKPLLNQIIKNSSPPSKPQSVSGSQSSAINTSTQSGSGSLLVNLSHSKPKVNLADPWLYYIIQQWNAREIQGVVKNPPKWNSSEVVSEVTDWYKEKIKCEFVDYLTEKTKLPFDKLDKTLSVGELIDKAVVKSVFDCLETTKSSLGNDEKMEQAAEKCINLVKGSKEIVEKEARKSIVEEFLGSIPNYGKLLGLFSSQGITTYDIIKKNEQEVKKK
ncbi:MAG: hypothetical protein ACK4J2_04560 [Sulfurihydrogenibium azorense]|uniref:hypothetical protein n=1 Tax=Sulfurihydrogenibium azorense TaxID=309806 RepID=UPI0039198A59